MPLARVVTSAVAPASSEPLLRALSRLLASELGKPESYVMTCLEPRAQMTFAGSTEPAAYVEIKSIGTFTPERTRKLAASVSALVSEHLKVAPGRTFIEFADAQGYLWGHDGDTLA